MNFNFSRFGTCLLAFVSIFLTFAMIYYPKDVFDSATVGLELWGTVVFPSLLPFFILSEILMGVGVVHLIGVLLEPLMRPLFNVPGIGAFALSLGLASGYPMDAVITSNFRKNKLCTAVEAERLLSFTNTADPLFLFGAVAVGMFGMPEVGVILALAHYSASFLVGFLFRFHGIRKEKERITSAQTTQGNILRRSLRALLQARRKDGRPLGKLLGDAVKESMHTSLLIGGFIILFSVFLRILSVIGITDIAAVFFTALLTAIQFDPSSAHALVAGLFEIDLGALSISQTSAPLEEKLILVSAVVAWSGLSVHGQVASIVIDAGISMVPYMIARALHAVFAAVLTLLFFGPLRFVTELFTLPAAQVFALSNATVLTRIEQVSSCLILLLALLIAVSLSVHLLRTLCCDIKKG